ncbi:MAG: PAS domain S-box protein [Chlorobiaceae bacterium]|nr:PAS domain S-box protein [Chlorobiaceae bacterium]
MKEPDSFASPDVGDMYPDGFSPEECSRKGCCQIGEISGLHDQAFLQSILRTVPAGIGIIADRVIIEINQRACDILGYSRDELVGRNSRILYLTDRDYDYVGIEKYRQIAECGVGTVEILMRRKDGRVINIVLSSSPLDPLDQSRGVTFTILDITAVRQAEMHLHDSEEKYRNLVECSIQGTIIGGGNPPRILFASKPTETISGYTPAELTSFTSAELFSIIHPDDRQAYYEAYRDRMDGVVGQVRHECRIIHKNGGIRWVEVFGTVVIYEGNPATQTVMVDITDRKHAEDAMARNREWLNLLFENIRDGIFVYSLREDGTPGTFQMVNRTACSMLGYDEQEILAMSPPDFCVARSVSALSESGSNDNSCFVRNRLFEVILTDKQGRSVPAEVSSARIDFSGRPCVIATVRDISSRKRSEEQINKITTALHQSPAVVVMTNAAGEIEYVNPRFTELTGYTPAEVYGKNPRILQSGTMSSDHYLRIWKTILSGKTWKGEFLNRKKNGDLYWETATIAPVMDDNGNITHYVAIKEDVTDKKRLWSELVAAKEKAEQSDRLKTAFLANMSHEIRTPMNGILGFSELLKDSLLSSSKKEEYIELILQSGRRMLCIINDLIDISKIETGEIIFHSSETSLHEVVMELKAFFAPQMQSKGLYLICGSSMPPDESVILTDRNRLVQILTNLLQNALKYTTSGGVEFGYFRRDDALVIYVKDTGKGIPTHLHEKVFDRFHQGEANDFVDNDGVGLGLSISKSLVEMLGGRLSLESRVGEGSLFSFALPYRRAEPVPEKMQTEENREVVNLEKSLQVLIAEDDAINRLLLEKLLERKQIKAISVVDGAQAVSAIRANAGIDLVLMDIRMPRMNGYEALTEIKRIRPDLPIVAHTAFSSQDERKRAIKAGFDGFLTKPVDIGELFRVIGQLTECRK